MTRIYWLGVLLWVIMGSGMPSHGETASPIKFGMISNPELWTVGENPAYIVVTGKNWSTYYSNPPQGTDFAKNIYIVASLGMKPNPGYTVKIGKLQQEKDKITIKLKLGEPDPKKAYAQVIVYPISVAEIPVVNLPPSKSLSFVFLDQKGKQLASIKADY